ncbi:MAG: helix-turn-helix transcriptional regulator, partial [Chloroflexota bacterium]|nr:helix-turn-helix transcriptional regulator [Chloroflexota bacterium]
MPEQPTPTPVAPAAPLEEPKPDPLAASVAAAIGKLRRDAGLSERAAAKKLGTSQTQLRRMEDPRYLPSLRSLARVATAYGAHLVVSFGAQDERPKDERPAAKTALAREPATPKATPAKPARTKKPAR